MHEVVDGRYSLSFVFFIRGLVHISFLNTVESLKSRCIALDGESEPFLKQIWSRHMISMWSVENKFNLATF